MTRKLVIGIGCVLALAIPLLLLYGIFGVDRVAPPDPLTEKAEAFTVEDALLVPQKTELLPLVQEQLSEPEPEHEHESDEVEQPEEASPVAEAAPPDEEMSGDVPNDMPGDVSDDVPGISEDDLIPGGDNEPSGDNEPGELPEDKINEEISPDQFDDPQNMKMPDIDNPDHDGDEVPEYPLDEPEEKTPVIKTDLRTQTLTAADGDDDTYPLSFTAELVDGEEDMELCVFYRSVSPTGAFWDSGELQVGGDGYEMLLVEGTHTFTFRVRQSGKMLSAPQTSRVVTWSTNKNPPTISAYLGNNMLSDGCTVEEETQEPLLKVSAKDYQGKNIPVSGIKAWLDGKLMTNYTGSAVKEYKLWLSPPDEGDCAIHTITVLAQDAEGQTAEETYIIEFIPIAEGDTIGWATVYFDCTTVGLGLLDSGMRVEIRQGYPASYVLKDCLEAYAWDFSYSGGLGGPDDKIGGFYLKSIIGPDFSYANPSRLQPELWACIQNDGLEIDTSLKPNGALRNGDELGEFDFTSGSGWMYEVNNYYPGRGLSEYYLQDGDVLILRFTLAYGKDIGQSVKNTGQFKTYCRTWVNDSIYPGEHPSSWYEEEEISATCTEEGERLLVCPCCGHSICETIPALGHEMEYVTVAEATCTELGIRRGVCSRCGEATEEESPALGHNEIEVSRTEPDCTEDGEVVFRCTVCDAERMEQLSAIGHAYSDGVCTRCGASDPAWIPPEPPLEDDDEGNEDD